MPLGSANSISLGRLLPQMAYYAHASLQHWRTTGRPLNFVVPTGNLGNALACFLARSMGLPIHRLILATNENNVLEEFFRTGVYRLRGAAETLATSSPSMDISKASNFERFVFDLLGRDAAQVAELFGRDLPSDGAFDLSATPEFAAQLDRFGFVSGTSTHADRIAVRYSMKTKLRYCQSCWDAREVPAEVGVPAFWPSF